MTFFFGTDGVYPSFERDTVCVVIRQTTHMITRSCHTEAEMSNQISLLTTFHYTVTTTAT
jgi:hypothetical protein